MEVLRNISKDHWAYDNLGARAKETRKGSLLLPNPFIQPARTQRLVDAGKRRLNCEATYGGWLEDRRYLWQGTYLDGGEKYIHLGYDFNVESGTQVFATQNCRVVRVGDDHPLKGGWGPHVVVRLDSGEGYLIYGHLLASELPEEGERLDPTCYIGFVGKPKHNGKWYPHLHVQFMTPQAGEHYLQPGRWEELDGYCNENDVKKMVKQFRDPLPWVA